MDFEGGGGFMNDHGGGGMSQSPDKDKSVRFL